MPDYRLRIEAEYEAIDSTGRERPPGIPVQFGRLDIKRNNGDEDERKKW